MDRRRVAAWRSRLPPALAALLPAALHGHPDATVLFETADEATAAHEEAPLRTLAEALALGATEQTALALAWWSETEPRFGAALGLLQGSAQQAGATLPTVGLVLRLAAPGGGAQPIGVLLQGAALASGLLHLGEAGTLSARTLQLPLPLLAWLAHGQVPARARLGHVLLQRLEPPPWPLPARWTEGLRQLAEVAAAGPVTLVLRGVDDDELRAAAAWLAHRCGRQACELQGDVEHEAGDRDGVVPALCVARALPVWCLAAAPGSTLRLPRLPLWNGPRIVLAGPEGAIESGADVHEFELPLPDADDRWALWQAGVAPGHAADAAERAAVRRSHCGVSILARAALLARRGGDAAGAIEQALRASARGLSAWAQVSTDHVPPAGWVGAPEVQEQLALLATRCRLRGDAAASLGPLLDGRLGPGVKALFIGASGTGKTLAAQWLADCLARPLVRVDLAAVVSKYIGETEKNLSQLLARAEHLDAVLLFDEADSLFGARTEVRQANDRYANMQTNYLLQRLETFQGVALLTSNSKSRFDGAFMRRLDAVIEFALPDAGERRRLWQLHLGETAVLAPATLDRIAALATLPGGHIRNAALTAALLARQRDPDGEARMQVEDLLRALAQEYRKLGQQLPDGLGA